MHNRARFPKIFIQSLAFSLRFTFSASSQPSRLCLSAITTSKLSRFSLARQLSSLNAMQTLHRCCLQFTFSVPARWLKTTRREKSVKLSWKEVANISQFCVKTVRTFRPTRRASNISRMGLRGWKSCRDCLRRNQRLTASRQTGGSMTPFRHRRRQCRSLESASAEPTIHPASLHRSWTELRKNFYKTRRIIFRQNIFHHKLVSKC